MAKTKISEFDSNPANNTDINSINIAEGCAPSGINNAIRQLMADLKDQQTGASGDDFTVSGTLSVTGTSLVNSGTAGTLGSSSSVYLSGGSGTSRAAVITGVNTGGANNAHALTFSTNAGSSAPTERMRIDSSGNLRIGDSTTYTIGNTPRIQMSSTTGGGSTINAITWSASSASTAPVYNIGRSRGTTAGDYTAVASGDDLGYVYGWGTDGTAFRSAAFMRFTTDGTPSAGYVPGRIVFATGTDAVAPTERMRITTTGRITTSNAANGIISALTDGATITPDLDAANNFSVTLGGNRAMANPTNITAGQSGSIFISQDGTGSRTLSWGSYWDFPNGAAPTLSTTVSAVDRVDYIVRSSTSIHAVFTSNYS